METGVNLSALPTGLITEFGAFGLLAWMVWYTAKTLIPRSIDRVIEASDRVAAAQRESTAVVAQAMRDAQRTMGRLTVAIIYHDATVRGVSPETVGSHEELMQRILEV